ncbi:MAG: hypothetical protein LBP63_01620 [Prevotellaceae bacterium]|jgi:hypothetical protein|nr:hypothetical protein [Prevotellaceae bacterium]
MENLDVACKIATVIIALVNVSLVIYIFIKNAKRDSSHKERERKINLLKTLVLDYGMKYFYQFFDDIDTETQKLKNKNLNNATKKEINDSLLKYGKTLEQKFTDLFWGINQDLRTNIYQKTDNLLDGLTKSIFDCGINLYDDNKFNNLVSKQITDCKSEIIKILFSYPGK